MGRGWTEGLDDLGLTVACGGESHRLVWHRGRVRADAHPDIDGELALAAFGGELPACVDAVARWRAGVADGGFLGEWCDNDLDDPVYRHHLGIAVSRLRAEGVQDVLRSLSPRRAETMGRFLLGFPQCWVDRAALGVVRTSRRWHPADPRHDPVRRALQVRARTAFVSSLARWAAVVRPAALVRFRCVVTPWGTPAQAAGVLDGTASWCRLALDARWLVDVWGTGRVLDGHGDLVLDRDGTCLRWERTPDGLLTACVRPHPTQPGPA